MLTVDNKLNMLIVIMLNVIMLSVVAPVYYKPAGAGKGWWGIEEQLKMLAISRSLYYILLKLW